MKNSDCQLCVLHKTANTVCLMGSGRKPAKVMIVGEAPGKTEDEEGKPFVGASGELLTSMLDEVGFKRDEVYITNAVHCRPPKNRTPKKKEIEACKVWLDEEIKAVKPRFILVLGNTPLFSLLGLKGIKKYRGQPIEKDGVLYYPAFHPAFALRGPKEEGVLRQDLKTFKMIVSRGGVVEQGETNVQTVTKANLGKALRDIRNTELVSYDLETSGLDPFAPGAYVASMGVGTASTQWVFPLNHWLSPIHKKFKAQARLAKRVLAILKEKKIVGHNIKFDCLFTRVMWGVRLKPYFCTMLAHYNCDENSRHDLKFLSQVFFKAVDYDIPLEEKQGLIGSLERHAKYLGLDLYYTRRLYYKLLRLLKEDIGTNRLFWGLTMPVCRLFIEVEYEGVYVDPVELEKAYEEWKQKYQEAKRVLNEEFPSDRKWKNKKTKQIEIGINWNSPDQVAEVLFDKLKLPSLEETEGGKPSTSESVLLRLAHQSPIPKMILQLREAAKNLNTYMEPWMRDAIDNRLHPSFKIHGTVTGRPSCENPNLQNVPRDPRIRGLITAPPGWTLVDADFSQIELRLIAEDSGDRELILCYQTGVDVHSRTATEVMGIPNPDKEKRKRAKAVNFGFMYGMWWKKFLVYARDTFGVDFTEREAKDFREGFFGLYSDVPEWHKRKKKFARKFGYVRNMLGRLRRLPDAAQGDETPKGREAGRQAINSPIQSMASDLNLASAVELYDKLSYDYFRIFGTVHDAILMIVRNDKLDEVLPVIKKTMESPKILKDFGVDIRVPIISEIEIGPWSKGKKVEL